MKIAANASIYYHDIGDYLSREQKLEIIRDARSINGLKWTELHPDEHGDWINHRNEGFAEFIPLEPDKKFDAKSSSVFCVNSRGFETGRDAWVYNYSPAKLSANMKKMVHFYNEQVTFFDQKKKAQPNVKAKDCISTDASKISWTSSLLSHLERSETAAFEKDQIYTSLYRPFVKMNNYSGDKMIHRRGQFEQFFPTADTENRVICVSGLGGTKANTAIISNVIPDLNCLDAGAQCFPLYWYEKAEGNQISAFGSNSGYIRHDGITDWMLKTVRERFSGTRAITREHIFYYVYGLLHSQEYRETFSADLKKELPRIPIVESLDDFMAFSKAGKALAELHLHYDDFAAENAETATRKPAVSHALAADKIVQWQTGPTILLDGTATAIENIPEEALIVNKIRFASKEDKSTILYNNRITLQNIPAQAHDYIVNGRSALEWILDRYQVKTDKDSGILNDPNDWAREHNSPAYILNLLLSVIDLSVKSVGIVNGLPKAGV
ncbi:MAG: hypothetical protein AUK31_05790 [Fibrobacteres bacterium CG2_30_45_31]|nr:MAG: hypothetical protein AUK31_05790 [Fibrobacteres bacterium CG2_30_45_31]